MSLRRRPVTAMVALAIVMVVALPAPARACELLDHLLVGCEATPQPGPPPPLVPGIGGVITLPTVPGPAPPAPPPPPPPPPASPSTTGVVLVPEAARHLLALANQERAAAGAPPVMAREDVTRRAEAHSLAMADRGSIWHDASFVTQATASLLGATSIMGENVAWSTHLDDAHRRLMASPGHRTNLVDPRYSVAGFAVARSGDGKFYVTQQFLQPAGPAPAPPAGTAPGLPTAPATAPRPDRAAVPVAAAGDIPALGPTTPAADPPARSPAGTATGIAAETVAGPGRADGAVLATATPAPAPGGRGWATAAALALMTAVWAGLGWRLRRRHGVAA